MDYKGALSNFWNFCFPDVFKTFQRLVTLNGHYALKQRELGFCVWSNKTKSHVQWRRKIHTEWSSVTDILRTMSTELFCIQVGAIFPGIRLPEDLQGRELEKQAIDNNVLTTYGELFFDIDLNDYDRTGVCKCGDARRCCDDCFKVFMGTAIKVLDFILKDFFGFRGVFRLFTGRRGINFWVLDARVTLDMNRRQRQSIFLRINNLPRTPNDELYEQVYEKVLRPQAEVLGLLPTEPAHLFQRLYPKLDLAFAKDVSHFKRVPLSLHPDTLTLCRCIPDDGVFIPSRDAIHVSKIHQYHMLESARIIEAAFAESGL